MFIKKFTINTYKIITKAFFTTTYLSNLKEEKELSNNPYGKSGKKILGWLVSRANLHLIIIIISLFIAVGNIHARGKGQSDHAAKTILFRMLGNEEEELIEEFSLLVGQVSQADNDLFGSSLRTDSIALVDEQTIDVFGESQDTIEQLGALRPGQEINALVQPRISSTSSGQRTEIIEYTVGEGDVLGTIAEKFGVSISTILWENNLTARSVIRPGQKLTILPTTGITHKVKSGDTIGGIAKNYRAQAENIIEYNNLEDAASIKIGQVLIIPNGRQPEPIYITPSPTYASQPQQVSSALTPTDQQLVNQRVYSRPESAYGSHRFPWGQCTWYVAQRRHVPWSGHAKQWIANARAYGYQIGNTPRVGAIIVTRESWYGHVGYVEAVGSGTVTFAESNYRSVGVITRRTLSVNDNRILGYIY